jgi:hypothetical protein
MAKLIGTWVLGDKLRPLIFRVKDTATTYRDLTGATVVLQGKRQTDVNPAIAVTGTVDPDQVNNKGKVTFADITNGLTVATADVFRCRVKVTQTDSGWTEEFDIRVEKWP